MTTFFCILLLMLVIDGFPRTWERSALAVVLITAAVLCHAMDQGYTL